MTIDEMIKQLDLPNYTLGPTRIMNAVAMKVEVSKLIADKLRSMEAHIWELEGLTLDQANILSLRDANIKAADDLAGAIRFVDKEMGLVPGTILGALTIYERRRGE